jgi:Zn-dependent protease with chaperone function
MMQATSDRPAPRPNPFAFPSETAFRFALLVAAVLGATLYVWNWIWTVWGAGASEASTRALACAREAQEGAFAAGGDPLAFARVSDTFTACVQSTYAEATWWMLGGVGLVLVVTAALTLLWPYVKERRSGFRPLEATDAPEVLATLGELSREAGLSSEPRWLWNPLNPAPTGLAFGHPGRYRVALTGGLVVRHTADPDGFRAIVRHELAHIRNRDVALTYATLALWYAFLAASVAPFLVTIVDEGEFAFSIAWRLLALAGLVYLTRNAVLRSREIYADVRASAAEGRGGALERVLAALPGRTHRLPRRLLELHPAPEQRIAALRDTRSLFLLGPIAAFAAGVSATVNFDSVQSLVYGFVDDPVDVSMIAALVFAPLVVGVVGVALWRDRFGALASSTRAESIWPLGLALVAGLLVGPELSLAGAVPGQDRGLLADLLHGEGILWVVALAGLVLLLLDWIADSASIWLRAEGSRRWPAAWAAGLLVAAGVLTIVLGAFYTLNQLSEGITFSKQLTAEQHAQVAAVTSAGPRWLWQLVMDPQTLVLLSRPLIPLAIVCLWVVPLSAALVRRHRTGEAPWAFLDPGGRLDPDRPRVRLLRPLAIGMLGGIACVIAYALHRAGVHSFVDLDTRNRDEFLLAFFFWQVVIALVTQGVVGGLATGFARDRGRLAEGICAATVTGTIAALGIVAGPAAGGCVDRLSIRSGPCSWGVSADFTWGVWRQVISEGAVAAFAAGAVVLAAEAVVRGGWLRRLMHPAPTRPAKTSP